MFSQLCLISHQNAWAFLGFYIYRGDFLLYSIVQCCIYYSSGKCFYEFYFVKLILVHTVHKSHYDFKANISIPAPLFARQSEASSLTVRTGLIEYCTGLEMV